jgi:molybdopterin molybdotransferase
MTGRVDVPGFDNAAMDGYALRAADAQNCDFLTLRSQAIAAGSQPQFFLGPGEAVRLFTGSPLPEGADTVVMQEQAVPEGDRLYLRHRPQPGEWVRRRGQFATSGQPLVLPGQRLRPPELAALAAAGVAELSIYVLPRVALLGTGDELVPPGGTLAPGQIYDSNSLALAALVQETGALLGEVLSLPDRPDVLQSHLARVLATADIVVTTGGVSVGDRDFLPAAIAHLGGQVAVHGIAMKPGKPFMAARFPQTAYYGLPGNPMSAMVCFWRLVRPAILRASGLPLDACLPQWVTAIATTDLHSNGQRETYLWGHLGQGQFTPAPEHTSGNPIGAIGTNALAQLRMHQTYIPAGDAVTVMPMYR